LAGRLKVLQKSLDDARSITKTTKQKYLQLELFYT
jgi:hypothetical protein